MQAGTLRGCSAMFIALANISSGCKDHPLPPEKSAAARAEPAANEFPTVTAPPVQPVVTQPVEPSFGELLAKAASQQTLSAVTYDAAYSRIAYPGGDVVPDRGVCSDVVVRAYRTFGIDLQVLVHEDMARDFSVYPRNWGLTKPDPNIDHRRVPNLCCYFNRVQTSLPVTDVAADYLPGDIVAWSLTDGRPHIGIVANEADAISGRRLVVHNIGEGPKAEDVLFDWTITGHFRCDDRAVMSKP